jgi:anti-sigma28 factor (negative regulator of flagellin synthesis)
MAADQAKDVYSFYTDLQRIQSLPPQARRQHIYALKREYNLLLGSPQYAGLNNELTAFDKSISDDIAAEKTRKEEERKETEFTQKQEERTVVKTDEKRNAALDQVKEWQEIQKVRRLRAAIAKGEFWVGGPGTAGEGLKQAKRLGTRSAGAGTADEIAAGTWLENVSKLKGALSDKEGQRLAVAGLKRTDSKERWLETLDEILDVYKANRGLMQDAGRWYIEVDSDTDKASITLGGTNPAVSEEEPKESGEDLTKRYLNQQ